MSLCEYTVTEAGFGADLGAEKIHGISNADMLDLALMPLCWLQRLEL